MARMTVSQILEPCRVPGVLGDDPNADCKGLGLYVVRNKNLGHPNVKPILTCRL